MIDVVAASLSLQDVPSDTIIILESSNGPQFPNGVVAESEVELPLVARRWWNPNCLVNEFDQISVSKFLSQTQFPKLPSRPETCVGWGPGLTPAGDDVVVGMLITFYALGMKAQADDLYGVCDEHATTPYSHALIRYAYEGQAARPVLSLMETLAGFGDLHRAIAMLFNFGATSGSYIMEGVRQVLEVSSIRLEQCDSTR